MLFFIFLIFRDTEWLTVLTDVIDLCDMGLAWFMTLLFSHVLKTLISSSCFGVEWPFMTAVWNENSTFSHLNCCACVRWFLPLIWVLPSLFLCTIGLLICGRNIFLFIFLCTCVCISAWCNVLSRYRSISWEVNVVACVTGCCSLCHPQPSDSVCHVPYSHTHTHTMQQMVDQNSVHRKYPDISCSENKITHLTEYCRT